MESSTKTVLTEPAEQTSLLATAFDPHEEAGFDARESARHRTMAALIFFVLLGVYLAIGGMYFSIERGWDLLDAVYFSVLTLTTIGYGDLTPETEGQKIFTIFYVLVGFCILGYALGHIGQYVAKREERLLMRQLKDARDGRESALPESVSLLARVALSAHGVMFFLAIGTLFFSLNEDWSTLDGLYFSAVSLTTVGYGDLRLHEPSSRVFAIFYLLLGTLMTAFFLGSIAELFMARDQRMRTLNLLYDESTNRELFRTFMSRKSGRKGPAETDYLEYMLVASGRIDGTTIREIRSRYQHLQKSGQL